MAHDKMTMISLFVLLAQANVAQAVRITASTSSSSADMFSAYVQRFGRKYIEGTEEYMARHTLFRQRIEEIDRHNNLPSRLWTAGVNHLTDWTESELASLRNWRGRVTADGGAYGRGSSFLQQGSKVAGALPTNKSWANLEFAKNSRIQDQGACGSCWAIATATMMNMHTEIYMPKMKTASSQELINCMPNPDSCGGQGGCAGATVELAMNYIMHSGLETDQEVPYNERDGKCTSKVGAVDGKDKKSGTRIGAVGLRMAPEGGAAGLALGLQGWERLPENKIEPLLRAVAELGPVAVSVAASKWGSYVRGVFDGCEKDAIIDHAVTLVGYGEVATVVAPSKVPHSVKYWDIQNSWGPRWGDAGRIKIYRHDGDDYCGKDNQPLVGTGCEGGPKSVDVCGMCGILYDSVVAHMKAPVTFHETNTRIGQVL